MILFGAIVGFLLSLLFLLGPLAVETATSLGLSVSIIGAPLTPAVNVSIFAGVIAYILVSVVLYVVASAATGTRPLFGPITPTIPALEEWCRGFLLGINASGHLLFTPIAYAVLALAFPLPFAGLFLLSGIIGPYLCLMTLAASVASGNRTFNAFLGWSSLLSPMSWLVTLVGAVLGLGSLVAGALGAPLRVTVEWWTLTVVFHGTVPAFFPTAYNLGNFCFITSEFRAQSPSPDFVNAGFPFVTADGVVFHETGHTLSLAAFGPAFHYIGAIDQNGLANGFNAYAELIAESQSRAATAPFLAMWVPPVGPITGPAGVNATPTTPLPWPAIAPPLEALPGQIIPLDASTGVADPDGYPLAAINPGGTPSLGFLWVILTPPGSLAALANDAVDPATFIPDRGGDYVWIASHTDGLDGNQVRGLMSVVEARANGPYVGTPNQPVNLTAAGSTAGTSGVLPSLAAPGGPVLTLLWTISAGAAGAALNNPTSESPTFTAPAGTYEVTLTVNVLSGTSHSATAPVVIA